MMSVYSKYKNLKKKLPQGNKDFQEFLQSLVRVQKAQGFNNRFAKYEFEE